jgi:hypothetical protein
MVFNTTTSRETAADHTPAYITTLSKLGFEHMKKGK